MVAVVTVVELELMNEEPFRFADSLSVTEVHSHDMHLMRPGTDAFEVENLEFGVVVVYCKPVRLAEH